VQIFNLPYRRLAVGWAPAFPERFGLAAISQIPHNSKSAIRQSATLRCVGIDPGSDMSNC
jgi:hypothetical protein